MAKLRMLIQRYVQSLIACLYLFGGGFLQKKHRAFLINICTHFGFRDPLFQELLVPEITMKEFLGNDLSIQLTEVDAADGNITPLELMMIAALVKRGPSRVCFEIGTFDGRTTMNLALNQPEDGHVYTLDLPVSGRDSTRLSLDKEDVKYIDKTSSGIRFAGHPLAERIKQLYGDSATFDFSEFYNTVDLLFVDGAHSYEYVKSDSLMAIKMVRPKAGIILWHDYSVWAGVTHGLNELYSTNPEFAGMRHIKNTSLCVLWR